MSSDKVHLAVIGQDPISYGKHGADYRWNQDYSAYRIVLNRWTPGSDSSYAMAQGELHIPAEYWDNLRATDPIT